MSQYTLGGRRSFLLLLLLFSPHSLCGGFDFICSPIHVSDRINKKCKHDTVLLISTVLDLECEEELELMGGSQLKERGLMHSLARLP